MVLAGVPAWAQGRQQQARQRIDVQSYLIDATINPASQTLAATALVRFTPLDDTSTVSFELNNALNLSKVVDEDGRQIPASRTQSDMTVQLSFPQVLQKGKVAAVTFIYDGKLTGSEESPVFGIKFAAIHPDFAYLMYPARWFPVNDYTADRFSADVKVTVPEGYKVVGSGIDSNVSAPAGTREFDAMEVRPGILPRQPRRGSRRAESGGLRGHHDLPLFPRVRRYGRRLRPGNRACDDLFRRLRTVCRRRRISR